MKIWGITKEEYCKMLLDRADGELLIARSAVEKGMPEIDLTNLRLEEEK